MLGFKYGGQVLTNHSRGAGFTLIELATGVAILSILMAVGVPAFFSMIDGARIRSAASAFNSGVQLARAQAISRNAAVDFVPAQSGGALTSGWTVSVRSDGALIDSRSSQEGSSPVVLVGNNGSGVVSITFNGLGAAVFRDDTGAAVTGVNPLVFSFSLPDKTCAASGGTVRCLDVRVSPAGQNRLCDPVAGTGDTRAC